MGMLLPKAIQNGRMASTSTTTIFQRSPHIQAGAMEDLVADTFRLLRSKPSITRAQSGLTVPLRVAAAPTMIEYSANGEYGRSIFENLDCLLAGALDRDMTTTFTDYIVGFKNLMYLHYEAHTINQAERDILLSYLTLAQSDP